MTCPELSESPSPIATRAPRADPILEELWRVKAELNAASGYRVDKLAQAAREFDLEAALKRIEQVMKESP